jgi:hypothetical protein
LNAHPHFLHFILDLAGEATSLDAEGAGATEGLPGETEGLAGPTEDLTPGRNTVPPGVVAGIELARRGLSFILLSSTHFLQTIIL